MEMVSSCGVEVRAVIDTGAGISIVSPALSEKLSSPKCPWDGATLVLANGNRTQPTDAVEIQQFGSISYRRQVMQNETTWKFVV